MLMRVVIVVAALLLFLARGAAAISPMEIDPKEEYAALQAQLATSEIILVSATAMEDDTYLDLGGRDR